MGRFAVAQVVAPGASPFTYLSTPYPRSYGANLPSSLTKVLSSALGYSPRPPVSVYSTDTPDLERLEDFLEGPSNRFG